LIGFVYCDLSERSPIVAWIDAGAPTRLCSDFTPLRNPSVSETRLEGGELVIAGERFRLKR
jgi:hypothetical protein